MELFNLATKTQQKKYKLLPLTLSNVNKLDNTYNLSMSIDRTKTLHTKCNMHDVFNVVFIDPNNKQMANIVGAIDLYLNYVSVTEEDVAQSNKWYRTWADDNTFEENLKLMYNYFVNNVLEDLLSKVLERYSTYQEIQQGGPLFFIIMMNILLSNTKSASKALVSQLHNLCLTKFVGEDIDKVVSLAQGAMRCLANMNCLPNNIMTILLSIF